MGFDRSDHEPEEWDPEAEYADPESDSLTIPRVATEDAGSDLRSDLRSEFGPDADSEGTPIDADVPSDLLQAFWAIVLVVNAAVLALSLGVLFLLFEGVSTHGLALTGGGVVLFGFALRRYRNYRASDPDATASGDIQRTESDATNSTAGGTGSATTAEPRSPDDTDRP